MKKIMMSSVVIILMIILPAGFSASQTDLPPEKKARGVVIPEEIIMRVPEGEKQRKFPVSFRHAKHKTIQCTTCHHNAYETLIMSSCSVDGCHSDTTVRKGTESFFGTFHETSEEYDRGCVDCHKTRGQGPTTCKGCHLKR